MAHTIPNTNTEIDHAIYAGKNLYAVDGVVKCDGAGNMSVAYTFTPQIVVTAPTGSTVTAQRGSTTLTATEVSGTWAFDVPSYGIWTITAEKGSNTVSDTVAATEVKQYTLTLSYVKVYTITKTYTDSGVTWTRGGDAEGLSATAAIGTSGYSSDFDNLEPWASMKRETLSTGDVMVKIPKFYIKRTRVGNTEFMGLADGPYEDYTLHKLFTPDNGETVYDYVHVGAHKTTSGHYSKPNLAPLTSITRASFRTNAKAKGTGWGIIDLAARSAMQWLFMIEFATNNSQAALGRGYCDSNSSALNTGSCDALYAAGCYSGRPSGTDGKTGVMYRGIEDPFGNVWEWTDGMNWNGGTYYVCFNPANYADDTTTNYTALSYVGGSTSYSKSYISAVGLDASFPEIMLPSAASGGSETTFYCDAIWSSTGWRVFRCGGDWNDDSADGLFAVIVDNGSSGTSANIGSRLLKRPA